jgi:hypothetical protein
MNMKTISILFILIFASFAFGCHHPKGAKEKETEAIKAQKEVVAEQVSVKGKVIDSETGNGVSMAFIIIKGTTIGTLSGSDGGFLIQAPASAKVLVFNADGYESAEVDIKGNNELEVKLKKKSK